MRQINLITFAFITILLLSSCKTETQKEVEECKARYGMTPTELTEALGFYEYGGGGYHCIWFTEHDFELFQKDRKSVV